MILNDMNIFYLDDIFGHKPQPQVIVRKRAAAALVTLQSSKPLWTQRDDDGGLIADLRVKIF